MKIDRRDPIIKKAVKAAGGLDVLASKLGITKQAISNWHVVPAERAVAVCEATGGRIKPEQLRPDVFRKPVLNRAAP